MGTEHPGGDSASFTHVLNPFVCAPASEPGIASRLIYASLAVAIERASACGYPRTGMGGDPAGRRGRHRGAGQLDYVEHTLEEALAAIARMHQRYAVPPDSAFAKMEAGHFHHNARLESVMLRKLKRLPGVATLSVKTKRWLGRSH